MERSDKPELSHFLLTCPISAGLNGCEFVNVLFSKNFANLYNTVPEKTDETRDHAKLEETR